MRMADGPARDGGGRFTRLFGQCLVHVHESVVRTHTRRHSKAIQAMRRQMVQPAMGSGEPSGAVRLRAAARSVARQLSRLFGKRLVQRPRVLAGEFCMNVRVTRTRTLLHAGGTRRLPCLLDKHPRYLTCDTTLNPVPCYQPSPGSYHRKRERREAGAESTLNLKKKK